jgi:competence ComEA-like helix-hairpin-helix protein
MTSTCSNQQIDYRQKKDDRLVILLGIGLLLLFVYCFQQLNISPVSSLNTLKLQWEGKRIVLDKAVFPPLQKTEGGTVQDALIPAAFTPFFFIPLPINEADQQLLETISGIGPHLAAEIIKTRGQRGPFHSPEDLLHICGIGKKRMLKFGDQFSYR